MAGMALGAPRSRMERYSPRVIFRYVLMLLMNFTATVWRRVSVEAEAVIECQPLYLVALFVEMTFMYFSEPCCRVVS